ncbi:flavin reductase [Lactococcus hodotermopsidis]|uniref:Flavin reductase n=1 Tax=Pseudolactococcus hodotermopsidis TaxID=2709157 RepID=A0A6A0B8W4_9LACT|nr:flavin reductase family protein [Lactococcus hodotermopsidis]GFH41782.1 flavin reductase [Lactococcus hodotermopsidis]
MAFKEINSNKLDMNPFTKIGKEWLLITAGTADKHNTMTASWGGFGFLWQRNVATIYIRPQRYTKNFVDANDTFTLSFFGRGFRQELTYLGQTSGRDEAKIAKSGLTPISFEETVGFEEAEIVFVMKKLYQAPILPEYFLDKSVDDYYPEHDYHDMYIAEIVKTFVREK